MLGFVKGAWKLLVAIKDAMVLILLLLFFSMIYAGIKMARTAQDAGMASSGALYLALDGPIVEQPRDIDRLTALTGDEGPSEYRLRDVVRAIEAAAADDAIKAVVLDLDGFGGGGQVAMERVGAALDKVRAAGKPVLAHAGFYSDDSYLLAAHASEVWLSPLGMVGVTGPGGSSLYYKGLLDKLNVTAHVYRVGTYKSAVEPFIRADQSPEARQANEALVQAVWGNWLGNVAASGGYWVATAGDMIFAEPSTITGSIGVFGILPSFEQTLGRIGITADGVKATALSGEPDIVGGVSPQFDQLAQASVEDIYGKFVGLVAGARKLTPQRVDEIGQGRVWDGGTAHQLKLVDRFGGIEAAVAEAARRAGLDGDTARPRYFDPQPDRWAQLLTVFTGQSARIRTAATHGPRDWLSFAAARQQRMAMRVVVDLRGLVEGAAIRADCLECRAFGPAPASPTRAQAGWLATLVRWVGGRP